MLRSRLLPNTTAVVAFILTAYPLGSFAVQAQDTFRLQVLHASDLEGGVESLADAPNFAAVVERFRQSELPTIVLSAGDNYIPGPFFNAAGDSALRSTLDAVSEAFYGVPDLDIREAAGRADITLMNVIGFDASALGNHEFDAGPAVIRELIGTDVRGTRPQDVRWLGAQFPYLSANLTLTGDPSLAPVFTPEILTNTAFQSLPDNLAGAAQVPKLAASTIVERDGQRLGIIGATTPLLAQISSPGGVSVAEPGSGENSMADLAIVLQPHIDELLALGINKVILVSHLQQIALEQDLVPRLRGVDIAIAGGSDTLLADSTDLLRAGDVAGGPYPIVTTNADGDPALIVSTDGQYKYVGRLVVDFDDAGRVVPASITSAESGAYKTDDAGVIAVWGNLTDPFAAGTRGALARQLTDGVRGIVTAKDSVILGRTSTFLEGRRAAVRTEQTNLGDLTSDANLFVARQHDPTVAVSLKNGGGLRAEIGKVDGLTGELLPPPANPDAAKLSGEISQLDVENTLRFNNLLSLVTVTAAGLRDVLEHGVAATRTGATPGQFPQVGGVRFAFDPSLEAIRFDGNGVVTNVGQRIRYAALLDDAGREVDVFVRDGALVGEPTRPIRMVTLNFLAVGQAASPGLGGDGYPLPALGTNRIDLPNVLPPGGVATFAAAGSEQDAFAEYLAAAFEAVPYSTVETSAAADRRILNLAVNTPILEVTGDLGSGAATVVFQTATGGSYQVEAAETLSGPWLAVGAVVAGNGNAASVTDATVAATGRLYRVRRLN